MNHEIQLALESQNPWWFSKKFDTGIERLSSFPNIMDYLKAREIFLLTGARRTGKSTLVFQIIEHLLKKGINRENILYINLDDPFFVSMAGNPNLLRDIVEDYIIKNKIEGLLYLCIDEVQNYKFWAHTMKIFYDTKGNIKAILTGSTSFTLKNETATRLSGRYLSYTVYPLSFSEFLRFKGINKPELLKLKNIFMEYLKFGGFPRTVLEENENIKTMVLKSYYETIYLKDIILPNNLRNNRDVVNLLYYLISNSGNLHSYNRIAETIHISPDTVKEYIEYAENSYLIYTLTKFDFSVKKQLANKKKNYSLDTGLINAVSFAFSENIGRNLENLIFIALKRKYDEIYYHKGKFECDFIVKSGFEVIMAVQVTKSLKDPDTKKRELRGLIEAMNTHNLKNGIIITENESDELEDNGREIQIIPAYVWLYGDY